MLRRLIKMMFGGLVFFSILGFALWYQTDRTIARAQAANAWLAQCNRIALTMSREEVVNLMGPPSAEQPAKEADRVVLVFAHPAFDPQPRVWLDKRRQRVDELYCNRANHRRMTAQRWAEVDEYEAYKRRLAQETEAL